MSAIFLPEDVRELLKGKTVIYIGDSVQRSMYKDLVLLFQDKRYLTDQELRAKGELSFLGDELMEGGKKGEMTNSTKYREVRKFLFDSQTKVLYFFITACFGEYIEMVLKKLMKPDIIFMNSCLWDVHRYGTKGYEGYGPNLKKLVKLMKEVHPTVLFAWTTTPPVDIRSKAGFLEDRKDLVKINEVLRCNDIARQIMSQEKIPIADFADVFRHFTHHRASDGVHWNERAHRRMTNILLETVARRFNRPIPRPVSDEFNRNHDFDDRPPFPHSFSQPAFHHNDNWGSFDEDRWHHHRFMNDSIQDDFILGLDRSYGYDNYSYFEMEEEMPPMFMPPHGRRMLPMDGHPPMRPLPPPPPPPGYRFGTSEPMMMRDGRKRKGREDEVTDGFNKRQRMDENRRYSGSYERRMASPLVENRSRLNEVRKSLSPDLDEKPATSNVPKSSEGKGVETAAKQTENDADALGKNLQDQQSNVEMNTEEQQETIPGQEKIASSQTILANEEKEATVEGSMVVEGESKQAVPVEDQKAVGGATREGASAEAAEYKVYSTTETSGDLIEKPGDGRIDENLSVADKCIIAADEKPVSFITTSHTPQEPLSKQVANDEKAAEDGTVLETDDKLNVAQAESQTRKASVFSKLSSTTAMILQSIQKSSKPVVDVMQGSSKPDSSQEVQAELDEKAMEPAEKKPVSDEKSPDTTCEADSKEPLPLENVEDGVSKGGVASESSPGKENEAKAKIISYYDMEETLEDIEASLDKMDEDGYYDTTDFDEESLLLDDTDNVPTDGPLNVTTGDVSVGQVNITDGHVVDQKNMEQNITVKKAGESVGTGEKEMDHENVVMTCGQVLKTDLKGDSKGKTGDGGNVGVLSTNGNAGIKVTCAVEGQGKDVEKGRINGMECVNDTTKPSLVGQKSEGEASNEKVKDSPVLAASAARPVAGPKTVVTKSNAPESPGKQRTTHILSPDLSKNTSTASVTKTAGSVTTVGATSVPPVTTATTATSDSKSATTSIVTKTAKVVATTVSVGANGASVTSGSKTAPSVKIGTRTTAISYRSVTTSAVRTTTVPKTTPALSGSVVPSATAVPIGTKTTPVLSASVRTAAFVAAKTTAVSISAKTLNAQFGTRETPVAVRVLSKPGVSNAPRPSISASVKGSISAGSDSKVASSLSPTVLDAKPKLPCVPNPPSLDMKSPFFKPKISAKLLGLSGSPSKSGRVPEPQTGGNIVSKQGKPVKESVPATTLAADSPEKTAATKSNSTPKKSKTKVKDDGTPNKDKTKVKKKKKIGKKGSKTDGVENSEEKLKSTKDGGVKKKTKKDGKIKKKKLKNKIKNELLSNPQGNVGTENVLQKNVVNTVATASNEHQNIAIIEMKDRPKMRPQQGDNFNRNKQFQNQNIANPNAHSMHSFVPQPQTFQQQQQHQQQQQPLANSQHYYPVQQQYVQLTAQPQVVAANVAPQFQYGHQIFPNQTLRYGTAFNALGTNTMFVNPGVATGYQQMNYYGGQTANQPNGMNLQGTVTNAAQAKEYEHLAWL